MMNSLPSHPSPARRRSESPSGMIMKPSPPRPMATAPSPLRRSSPRPPPILPSPHRRPSPLANRSLSEINNSGASPVSSMVSKSPIGLAATPSGRANKKDDDDDDSTRVSPVYLKYLKPASNRSSLGSLPPHEDVSPGATPTKAPNASYLPSSLNSSPTDTSEASSTYSAPSTPFMELIYSASGSTAETPEAFHPTPLVQSTPEQKFGTKEQNSETPLIRNTSACKIAQEVENLISPAHSGISIQTGSPDSQQHHIQHFHQLAANYPPEAEEADPSIAKQASWWVPRIGHAKQIGTNAHNPPRGGVGGSTPLSLPSMLGGRPDEDTDNEVSELESPSLYEFAPSMEESDINSQSQRHSIGTISQSQSTDIYSLKTIPTPQAADATAGATSLSSYGQHQEHGIIWLKRADPEKNRANSNPLSPTLMEIASGSALCISREEVIAASAQQQQDEDALSDTTSQYSNVTGNELRHDSVIPKPSIKALDSYASAKPANRMFFRHSVPTPSPKYLQPQDGATNGDAIMNEVDVSELSSYAGGVEEGRNRGSSNENSKVNGSENGDSRTKLFAKSKCGLYCRLAILVTLGLAVVIPLIIVLIYYVQEDNFSNLVDQGNAGDGGDQGGIISDDTDDNPLAGGFFDPRTPRPSALSGVVPSMAPVIEISLPPVATSILPPVAPPTFSPTASPVMPPIRDPTTSPVASPTSPPFIVPVALPTMNPVTKAPVATATPSPTTSPTASPTKKPTASPTVSPTANPTIAPVVSTGDPTEFPTKNPTLTPTMRPTNIPNSTPTESPTNNLPPFTVVWDEDSWSAPNPFRLGPLWLQQDRSSSVFDISILNSMTNSNHSAVLAATIQDWQESSVLRLNSVDDPMTTMHLEDCKPSAGTIRICNGSLGSSTRSRVVSEIYIDGRDTIAATIVVNDDFGLSALATEAALQHHLCHHLGHALGAFHTPDGCMLDQFDLDQIMNQEEYLHPGPLNYKELEQLYGDQLIR